MLKKVAFAMARFSSLKSIGYEQLSNSGFHEVMRMRDHQNGLYDTQDLQFSDADLSDGGDAEDDGPAFDEPAPEMGKNIFALKIFLPAKLKVGLQHRAEKAEVPLGRFRTGNDLRPPVWTGCGAEVADDSQSTCV
ncbi:hypothetical protein [Polaromonas sp.]|jgi:hypothetical protein|uniref:hypothetical protein n=1 Tax=Polaromonas sp. TaxID=1869339 RepID=UPI001A2C85EE|nr:hypothetical protein [Burkholderiales bacterium]